MTPEEILAALRKIGLNYDYLCDTGPRNGMVHLKLDIGYLDWETWNRLAAEMKKVTK